MLTIIFLFCAGIVLGIIIPQPWPLKVFTRLICLLLLAAFKKIVSWVVAGLLIFLIVKKIIQPDVLRKCAKWLLDFIAEMSKKGWWAVLDLMHKLLRKK